jgi:hypothetical protein
MSQKIQKERHSVPSFPILPPCDPRQESSPSRQARQESHSAGLTKSSVSDLLCSLQGASRQAASRGRRPGAAGPPELFGSRDGPPPRPGGGAVLFDKRSTFCQGDGGPGRLLWLSLYLHAPATDCDGPRRRRSDGEGTEAAGPEPADETLLSSSRSSFVRFYRRLAEQMGIPEARAYVLHLIEEKSSDGRR